MGWLTAEAGADGDDQPVGASGSRRERRDSFEERRATRPRRTRNGSAKSGLGLAPTNFSSARVRATIVMRESMTATTRPRAFCWRTALKTDAGCARRARSDLVAARLTPIETKYWPPRDRGRATRRPAASSAARFHPIVVDERRRRAERHRGVDDNAESRPTRRTDCHAGRS